jgi:hypothetical protein
MMGAVRTPATALTRARRSTAALAVVGAGALVLAGCSGTMSSDVAAVVNGKEISVEEVQEATAQFNSLPVTPTTTSDALTLLIYGDLAEEAYTEAGLPPVPESQLVSQLRTGGIQDPSDSLVDLYRSITYLTGLQGLPPTDDLEIEVNPRFGDWDADAGQVIAQAPDWITDVTGAGTDDL